ncbi:MAG: hypothetical protein CMJ19_15875 [Phycisphaeraceae bacterium]|nr:hypothetical protein [Phycisphaeraceae bacterium]
MSTTSPIKRKRYAVVGVGGRARMFTYPICETYQQSAELVGLCDVNQGRLAYAQRDLQGRFDCPALPLFSDAEFSQMIEQTRPDVVIVCTVDCYHHQYIIRAMEMGCDVITEKPITTDADKCNQIIDAIERTDRQLFVAFNYRWGAGPTMVHQQLASGVIGQILHVDMEYMLNTSHGADYFRRWHREKEKSGGLMVHKSTHHFDLVNWWINAIPQTVFAMGRLAFYGKDNANRRGIHVTADRYTGQDNTDDPFALDLTADDDLKQLYLDNEKYDGYQRDRNVFAADIDIEDSMSVLVRYNSGTVLNYSLNCYLPCEGINVVFNGSKGRLEFSEMHVPDEDVPPSINPLSQKTKVIPRLTIRPHFAKPYDIPIDVNTGGHGGSDPLIQQQLFAADPPVDLHARVAGYQQGIASALIGIAANTCFKSGQPVDIPMLCPDLPRVGGLSDLI